MRKNLKLLFALTITTLILLNSCQNEIIFQDEDRSVYEDFKSTWVEPENYSFELKYCNHPESYNLQLNKYSGYYSVKVVKLDSEYRFYLSDGYYKNKSDYVKDLYEHEISKEDLIKLIGESNFIQSVSDCFVKFEEYMNYIVEAEKINRHHAYTTIDFDDDGNYFMFGVETFTRGSLLIFGSFSSGKRFKIEINNFKNLD